MSRLFRVEEDVVKRKLYVEVPGYDKADIDIHVDLLVDDRKYLTIKAENEVRGRGGVRIILPKSVDIEAIGSRISHGILEIDIPVSAKYKSRTVPIS